MEIASRVLREGEALDPRYAELSCNGENIRPDLSWFGAPETTMSYAVTCYDPDAPTGSGWWHWIGFDIPADVTSLPTDGEFPGREWENDYGYVGYGGPCPPAGHGPHRYVFTVYALDVEHLGVGDGVTSAAVRFMLLSHVLDQASCTVTFEVPAEEALAVEATDSAPIENIRLDDTSDAPEK